MRIVAFTSVSGPYIVARYSAFKKKLFDDHFFSLVELGKTSKTYLWNSDLKTPYDRIILSNKSIETQSLVYSVKKIVKILATTNPDILIVCGYYSVPAMFYVILWSLWNDKPIILLSDSKYDDEPRIFWKEYLKFLIVKRYKAALVGAESHKQYLTKLGMLPKSIFFGFDVVENQSFNPDKIRHLPCPLSQFYFLTVSRFVSKKNLFLLIRAYAEYRRINDNLSWDLVLSGDGELRPQIEQQINELGLQKFIHLPGFLQQEELLPYFAHASCFIHASTQEQWGLVVNEAMAAGLPVIVSNRCGCFEDLVIQGVNGFGFDPTNQQELTDLMLKMSSGKVDLAMMGEASLKHIQKYSPDYFAQGLMKALEYSLGNS
jgi:1,2-diacylglycerol 3-alpha-glucosyltransferase